MRNFNLNCFLDCAKELLRADETERALWLLDNLPAYYRDHIPAPVLDLKNAVMKKISTTQKYMNGIYECDVMDPKEGNQMEGSLRGSIILKDVAWLNQKGYVPHIVDCGPGEYWLPFVLKKQGMKFTYQAIYLNHGAHSKAMEGMHQVYRDSAPDKTQPCIFVACEIIEHLWQESELKTQMLFNHGFADIIHISTPRYTFDTECMNWDEKGELGHLRAYTPVEFIRKCSHIFPEYDPFFINSQIMHLRMTNRDTKFKEIKDRTYTDYNSL